MFRSRYLQLARCDHLEPDRIEALGKVLAGRPELEAAWRMLQHLHGIYTADNVDDANQALGAFIATHQQHPLAEFNRFTETLLDWGDQIFAFHTCNRISNGRIEGTNNKLGVLKRIAYGFVNNDNFGARALLQTPPVPSSP
jgi:transposase